MTFRKSGLWISVALALCLLGCEKVVPQPVAVTALQGAREVKAVVGKAGGRLQLANGARLVIPSDVLLEEIAIALKHERSTFNLSGKDMMGEAYRISPLLSFAPGTARLYVPLSELPGAPSEVNLAMYYFGKQETDGPEGPNVSEVWQPCPKSRFVEVSADQKYAVFQVVGTISDQTTKAPYGLLQPVYDLSPES